MDAFRSGTRTHVDHAYAVSLLAHFQSVIPNEIDVLNRLARIGDWQAVRLRLRNQMSEERRRLSEISASIDTLAHQEREQALAALSRARERNIAAWMLCAVLSVVLACLLGFVVTQSITDSVAPAGARFADPGIGRSLPSPSY